MRPAKPHSRDLRFGRISETGRIYHLRTPIAGGAPLFRDFLLGREVVRCMRFLGQRGDVESLAFVVMPDHLHWLVRLGGDRSLAQVTQSLKRDSARRMNQRLGRTGAAVWQPGFFDRALRAEDDLVAVARYIVATPCGPGSVAVLATIRSGIRFGSRQKPRDGAGRD